MDIRPVEICPLVWWIKIWDFGSNCLAFVRHRVGEWMISAWVVPTVKHRGGGLMVWVCCAGDTVCDLFRIQGTLNQHVYHSILQWYDVRSGFADSRTIICFSTGQWPNTPPGCVRVILPRRRVIECCIRWPGLHNPTSTQLRWFGMSWTAEWRKCSQQVLSICGNSFKTVGKAFQVKLVERIPQLRKAVIKANGGYFEESKVYFDLFNTFLVTTWFHMCYFIVLVSSTM